MGFICVWGQDREVDSWSDFEEDKGLGGKGGSQCGGRLIGSHRDGGFDPDGFEHVSCRKSTTTRQGN